MLMYKLKQDKDKSPTFASCCVPAWTVCSDTPQSSLGKLRWPPGPTGAGSGYKTKPKEVTCIFGTCWGRRAGGLGLDLHFKDIFDTGVENELRELGVASWVLSGSFLK